MLVFVDLVFVVWVCGCLMIVGSVMFGMFGCLQYCVLVVVICLLLFGRLLYYFILIRFTLLCGC